MIRGSTGRRGLLEVLEGRRCPVFARGGRVSKENTITMVETLLLLIPDANDRKDPAPICACFLVIGTSGSFRSGDVTSRKKLRERGRSGRQERG